MRPRARSIRPCLGATSNAGQHNPKTKVRTTGDGYYEAVISDPEGNEIEIVA